MNHCGQQQEITSPSPAFHPSQSLYPGLALGVQEAPPQQAGLLPKSHLEARRDTNSLFLQKEVWCWNYIVTWIHFRSGVIPTLTRHWHSILLVESKQTRDTCITASRNLRPLSASSYSWGWHSYTWVQYIYWYYTPEIQDTCKDDWKYLTAFITTSVNKEQLLATYFYL